MSAPFFSSCAGVANNLFLNKNTTITTIIGAYSIKNFSVLINPLNPFSVNIDPYSISFGHYTLIF